MTKPTRIRCAIYTRKSSEEGLEQAFNSLDAQREACAAYVTSQKHEGWVLLKDHYDDGGISGGTLERPAVQQLLADIDAGKVDRVIVYKVDRLTRSLTDFAMLVDRFDAAGASFVSVTQSFNTATSMGRLTLNVLLSFAQFEREVTAERIRDKISASKKKGMWMGGLTPLGYDSPNRLLVVNEAEAQTVRTIFDLYLKLGNVRLVKQETNRLGLRTKHRPHASGTARGGTTFSRGRIYYLLSNPVYIGRIRHKDVSYVGEHDPIIDMESWEATQAQLAEQRGRGRGRSSSKALSPLAGKFTDETGDRLTASHARKGARRYRYYISRRLIAQSGEPDTTGWRLPAEELEQAVTDAIIANLRDPGFSTSLLQEPTAVEIEASRTAAGKIMHDLEGKDAKLHLTRITESRSVSPTELTMTISADHIACVLKTQPDRVAPETLTIRIPCNMRRRGVETKLVIEGAASKVDTSLLRSVAKGRAWLTEITTGASLKDIADREGVTSSYIARLIDLAFLSPKLTDAIVAGKQPRNLSAKSLSRLSIPDGWTEQHALFDCE